MEAEADADDDGTAGTTQQLGHALLMLEGAYRDLRASMARDLGLGDAEFHALTAVAGSSGYTPKMLGLELSMTTGAVTALIDRLDRAGLLTRLPNPRDRRSVFLTPTSHGVDLLDEVIRRHDAAVREMQRVSPHLADSTIVEDLTRAAAVLAAHSVG
ncbi:MarR family transcriptional regulator [Rathayibacter sp. ZW T2_19]|uniref:MarR family transcriptional regulator n=1 Tax=Rathayibacter rubneri TaxID=2950106 RepID=A0A9X2DX63_9MICO|nr:MarR family transcriptional regulator [Rathayibacter rubneri]MCM6762695.1 MarR family transcriptional regulator [Rathayibacter rubneri]